MRLFPIAVLLVLFTGFRAECQQIPIESWRDELPYNQVISVTDAGDLFYAATPYSIFFVDKTDNSVQRMNKINGLSDIGISCICYSPETHTTVLSYTNANIDLIRNLTVTNISDIKRKQILGNKTINSIYCRDKFAYLACGFGIVVLDLEKDEINDTWYIGPEGSPLNVLDITVSSANEIYAATESGIYKASMSNQNLANFAAWEKITALDTSATYSTIASVGDRLFVNRSSSDFNKDTIYMLDQGTWSIFNTGVQNTVMNLESAQNSLIVVYNYFIYVYDSGLQRTLNIWSYYPAGPVPLDATIDASGLLWIGDTYSGLLYYNPGANAFTAFNLSGPLSAQAFSMTASGEDLYIAPGGRNMSYVPLYFPAQMYHFTGSSWYNLYGGNTQGMSNLHDIVTIAVDPNDPKRVYAGSFGNGLLEFYDGSFSNRYGEWNSTLRHHSASDTGDVRVSGVAFDNNGNLWVATAHNNDCLSQYRDNHWYGYNVPILQESDLGAMVIDKSNQVWVIMRYGNINPNSLLVFSDNGTPDNLSDDMYKKLNTSVGSGNLPGSTVLALAVDQDGEIWVGTEKGVAVFYSPENVFTGQDFDAQKILVEEGGYYQYLLENETVTAIAVDGNNQKWIGTDRGGVFLFSADGTKQLYHFTAEDSPLFSDRITSIAINAIGEVFFGTDRGVISFRGKANDGGETTGNVYAFPNPVKEGYTGWIAIKGLVNKASVKIIDVSGNLIFSTIAEGGQAIWDGNNFDGRRARTGVYMVLASDDTGNEKVVTKILFID